MSELEQWCEIDGHEWVESQCSYGLVFGPKTVHFYKRCKACGEDESTVLIPNGSTFRVSKTITYGLSYVEF